MYSINNNNKINGLDKNNFCTALFTYIYVHCTYHRAKPNHAVQICASYSDMKYNFLDNN